MPPLVQDGARHVSSVPCVQDSAHVISAGYWPYEECPVRAQEDARVRGMQDSGCLHTLILSSVSY